MESSVLGTMYDVMDASWVAHDRAVCDIVLSKNHVVKTLFDQKKQRFVSLSAASFDTEDTDLLSATLEQMVAKDENFPRRWFVAAPKTMLVPDALYEPKIEQELFENHQVLEEGDILASHPVARIAGRMIFALGDLFTSLLKNSNLKIDSFLPIDAAWLDGLYLNHKTTEATNIHLNLSDGFVSIAVFSKGQMQFYNTFLTITPEEVLYYLMFVSEQLGLNPLQDSYYYSGYIRKGDETAALLGKYVKNLRPEERPAQYSYCMPILDVPGHLFYNSFTTPVCE